MPRPVMADVAELAGVSISTVSLVVNGRPGVSSAARQAVLKAVEELGYRLPDRGASRSSSARAVSIVHYVTRGPVGRLEFKGSIGARIMDQYMQGIRHCLRKEHTNWELFGCYHESADTDLAFRFLNAQGFSSDGLILMGANAGQDSWLIQQILQERIPAVAISRHWPDIPISTVGQDHYQQAGIALDHLIQLGHRRIGFVAQEISQRNDWFAWRLTCYRRAMLKLNGRVDEEWISVAENGAESAKALMQRRPDVTAMFAVDDETAIQAMEGLFELGLDVPRDVSVIGLNGYTDTPEGYPALTTVGYPQYEVGYCAAEMLLRQIEDNSMYYGHHFVRSYLVEGASCRAWPPEDAGSSSEA